MTLSKEEMIFKQITNNIDKPFSIVIDKSNSFFSFNSYARGYHVYMNIWNAVDGDILVSTRETDNPHDKYTVSIKRNWNVIDHVPLCLSKSFETSFCRQDLP